MIIIFMKTTLCIYQKSLTLWGKGTSAALVGSRPRDSASINILVWGHLIPSSTMKNYWIVSSGIGLIL